MNLFQKGNIILSSGQKSDFKIECDALTDKDWECLAYLVSKKMNFSGVYGVPEGGRKLEKCLQKYCIRDNDLPVLICDDVLTTGNSMIKLRNGLSDEGVENIIGVVVFSRGRRFNWITPIFKMIN